MPADEASWARTDVIFVTGEGSVRRNSLSDFVRINANGKIAMKLKGSARLVGVALAEEDNDVLLATQAGQAVRFPVSDLRVFRSRGSTGVRGVRLRKGDRVISLAVLAHAKATAEECRAYLAESRRRRLAAAAESGAGVGEGAEGAEEAEEEGLDEELEEGETGEENGAGGGAVSLSLSEARYQEMAENEQIILSLAADGFGKRSSSYGYPIRRRGGMGVRNGPGTARGAGEMVAVLSVAEGSQIMLITDHGRMIRTSADDISVVGRTSRGVRVLRIDEGSDEALVSVAHLAHVDEAEAEAGGENGADGTGGVEASGTDGANGAEASGADGADGGAEDVSDDGADGGAEGLSDGTGEEGGEEEGDE